MASKKKAGASQKTLEALYSENRKIKPPRAFRERAVVSKDSIYKKANKNPEAFWGRGGQED